MIEDKLTQDQRIRLECINQANATVAATPDRDPTGRAHRVVSFAELYENYIRNGDKWADPLGTG